MQQRIRFSNVTRTVGLSRGALCLTLASFALACASGGDVTVRPSSAAAPAVRLVRIGSGIAIEVVDWGGRGDPLVFLAGGGGTAHVFDEFAPQFTDSFHVLGMTRRGFGASSGTPASELDTLVADIAVTLDTLGLGGVILVGHSIAGEEMTRFAELHPGRCRGLIYIDAAYDRSGIDTLAALQPAGPAPRIDAADTTSFASIRALYARVMGVRKPDSEIRATVRFDSADRYLGPVTPNSLQARLASGKQTARYDRVRCPSLGIYAMADSLVDVVPYSAELDSAGRAQSERLLQFVRAVIDDSRARFARLPDHSVVEVRHANHFVFLQRPTAVARAMRAFLSR